MNSDIWNVTHNMMWLGAHKEVENYLILDNMDLHSEELSKYQIRTDSAVGLTEKNVEQAIMMLSE